VKQRVMFIPSVSGPIPVVWAGRCATTALRRILFGGGAALGDVRVRLSDVTLHPVPLASTVLMVGLIAVLQGHFLADDGPICDHTPRLALQCEDNHREVRSVLGCYHSLLLYPMTLARRAAELLYDTAEHHMCP